MVNLKDKPIKFQCNTLFHRIDALYIFQEDSRGIDLKHFQNGDSFWFHTYFHHFIHVFWTKCIGALRKVSGFVKFYFLQIKHKISLKDGCKSG